MPGVQDFLEDTRRGVQSGLVRLNMEQAAQHNVNSISVRRSVTGVFFWVTDLPDLDLYCVLSSIMLFLLFFWMYH